LVVVAQQGLQLQMTEQMGVIPLLLAPPLLKAHLVQAQTHLKHMGGAKGFVTATGRLAVPVVAVDIFQGQAALVIRHQQLLLREIVGVMLVAVAKRQIFLAAAAAVQVVLGLMQQFHPLKVGTGVLEPHQVFLAHL
jgi:hypothetical protein